MKIFSSKLIENKSLSLSPMVLSWKPDIPACEQTAPLLLQTNMSLCIFRSWWLGLILRQEIPTAHNGLIQKKAILRAALKTTHLNWLNMKFYNLTGSLNPPSMLNSSNFQLQVISIPPKHRDMNFAMVQNCCLILKDIIIDTLYGSSPN